MDHWKLSKSFCQQGPICLILKDSYAFHYKYHLDFQFLPNKVPGEI